MVLHLYLHQALLASSYVPVYAGFKPVEFIGEVMALSHYNCYLYLFLIEN